MAGGGAMGMRSYLLRHDMFMLARMAESSCMASWGAYAKVHENPHLKRLAKQDLGDAHAVALANTIGHLAIRPGSAFAWDNGLFNFVGMLYLSRCLRETSCWTHLRVPAEHLLRFSTFGANLAENLGKMPRGDKLTDSIHELYADGQQVLDEILCSEYVFRMPGRHEGSALSQLLRDTRDNKRLYNKIAGIYTESQAVEWNAREHAEDTKAYICAESYDLEECSRYEPLTVGQGLQLLQIIQNNKLAKAIVTTRPPCSQLISHFMAILDCTEHARLLLNRSDLPVYYGFPRLKYSGLTMPMPRKSEYVIHSPAGFGERVPSPVEKLLRRLALDASSASDKSADIPHSFLKIPREFTFGGLKTVPWVCDGEASETWFRKFLDLLQTMATCEPLDKLRCLVGSKAIAQSYTSKLVDVSRATKGINWIDLLEPQGDELVYRSLPEHASSRKNVIR